tara:strand:+ start:100 stop:798 length:699 start_codon:yes stop_codon:yes gene_type:complete
MKAVILAAGRGTRLYPLTTNRPKSLLKIGNKTLLNRLVDQLKEMMINEIIIVVGFNKDMIIEEFKNDTAVNIIAYNDFEKTNNLFTLWSVKEELVGETIISFADIILEKEIIKNLIKSKNDICMAYYSKKVLDGTMPIKVVNSKIENITTTKKEDASGNFIGIGKFSHKGCKILIEYMNKYIKSENFNDYYTIAIDNYVRNGGYAEGLDIGEYKWTEIDDMKDYDLAKKIFN